MSTLNLVKRIEKQNFKHPTGLLHFERTMSDAAQGIMALCVKIVQTSNKDENGRYLLSKGLARAVLRKEHTNYNQIDEAVQEIAKTDLTFNIFGEDRTFNYFSGPLITGRFYGEKSGVIGFDINPRIEKLIKDPRVFSQLNLVFVGILGDTKRGYSFYCLLKDHLDRGFSKFELPVKELRQYLGCDTKSYQAFKVFRKLVLNPLVQTINDRTDVGVKFDTIKAHRTVEAVSFEVEKKAWQPPLFDDGRLEKLYAELAEAVNGGGIKTDLIEMEYSEDLTNLIEIAGKYNVTAKTVERAVRKFGTRGTKEILDHAEQSIRSRSDKVKSQAAYMAKFLNEGTGIKTDADRVEEKQVSERNIQAREKRDQSREVFLQAVKFRFVNEYFKTLQREQDRELLRKLEDAGKTYVELFKKKCEPSKLADFLEKGWNSVLCRQEIREFAANVLRIDLLTIESVYKMKRWDQSPLFEANREIEKTVYKAKLDAATNALRGRKRINLEKVVEKFFGA